MQEKLEKEKTQAEVKSTLTHIEEPSFCGAPSITLTRHLVQHQSSCNLVLGSLMIVGSLGINCFPSLPIGSTKRNVFYHYNPTSLRWAT